MTPCPPLTFARGVVDVDPEDRPALPLLELLPGWPEASGALALADGL